MNQNTLTNYLEFSSWEELVKSLEEFESATMIFWLFDRLISGIHKNGSKLIWSENSIRDTEIWENIIEARIFNESKELYCRRINNKIYFRIREDKTVDEASCKDYCNFLLGAKSSIIENQFTILSDEKGTELTIPGVYNNVDQKNPVKLIIRNYIGYNDRGMAGYVDARFVKITK